MDVPMRVFHWLLAFSFAGAWLTGESERWRALHVSLGYAMVGLLVLRLAYGLWGPRPVRLAVWWRKLQAAPDLWRRLRQGAADGRGWQNLAMAAVIAGLLAGLPLVLLSGYATYAEWGGDATADALEELHEVLGNAALLLVGLHLALLALLSALRRQNQALPMLNGRLPGAGPDLVRQPRALWGWLLLAAMVAFMAWRWQVPADGWWPRSAWPRSALVAEGGPPAGPQQAPAAGTDPAGSVAQDEAGDENDEDDEDDDD